MPNEIIRFVEYSKSDYVLTDPKNDILGFAVYDRDGEHVGHIEELLLDNTDSLRRDQPGSRRVVLAIVNVGGLLGHDQVAVPFEAFNEVRPERREVVVNYPKEFFEQEQIAYHGVNFLDQDAEGRIYGLYEMNDEWFDERAGSDPDLVKYG